MTVEDPDIIQPLEIPMMVADKESPIKIDPNSEYAKALRGIKATRDLKKLRQISLEYRNILNTGAGQLSREDLFGCGAVIRYAEDKIRRIKNPGLQKGDITFLKRGGYDK